MKRKRFSVEQIVAVLKQAEAWTPFDFEGATVGLRDAQGSLSEALRGREVAVAPSEQEKWR